jgi:hypothetical protein
VRKRKARKIVLTSVADFFNGMATAWAFASYDAIFHLAWIDLLSSLLLAILSLSASMSIKIKLAYDKHT